MRSVSCTEKSRERFCERNVKEKKLLYILLQSLRDDLEVHEEFLVIERYDDRTIH